MSEYEERDTTQFLGLYMKHVEAMTSESLISKSRIAEELAFRDKRIAELVREMQASNDMFDKAWQVISEASEEGRDEQLREYAEKVRGL